MATVERFNAVLKRGSIALENGSTVPLTAQMKYDYLAAVHTMEQLLNLNDEIEKRKKKRETQREKISNNCRAALKNLVDSDEIFTVKKIDAVIKILHEFHSELEKMDIIEAETAKLAKFVEDGVSAGR